MEKLDFSKNRFIRLPIEVFTKFNKGLNSTDLVVYTFIASKVNNTSMDCTLSANYISASIGVSKRTVSRSLIKLEEENYIKHTKQFREDGGRKANLYTLLNIGNEK